MPARTRPALALIVCWLAAGCLGFLLPAAGQTSGAPTADEVDIPPARAAETSLGSAAAEAAPTADAAPSQSAMSWLDALILGVVEGVTEYLPVSSTGHLLATQELLGIVPQADRENPEVTPNEQAANAFAIAIQGGAILAVLGLYWPRCRQMLAGLTGRDLAAQPGSAALGRKLIVCLLASFAPAVVIGLLAEDWIEARLFGLKPIIAAWIVGGIGILLLSGWLKRRGKSAETGRGLDQLDWKTALGIGLFQCAAMWPGTSRSLMTIAGALLLGLSLSAAVEYSFLLGVLTLGAATSYALVKDGELMLQHYSLGSLVIGFVAAAVSAAVAVKWMVGYLKKHDLAIFGWYRLVIGALAALYLSI